MEVTTVPPSPASPTEGDDLCETDVTNLPIHSVTLLICLCGLAGNGAVICLLRLKSRNSGIFDLALADFLFLLFTVPSALLFLVEDVSCAHLVPVLYLRFLFQLSLVSYYWGLFWLMPSRPVVYMYKLCNLCCRCYLPLRLRWVVGSAQYCAFLAVFTVIPAVTFLCQSQEQEHCQAALISMYAIIVLLFFVPVVIFHTIDFIKAKWDSQKQQPKRRDMVILLTMLFILLLSICTFLQQLGYIIVSSQAVFLLTSIHSSFKPFIYFLAGSSWRPCSMGSLRLSLQRVFEDQKEITAHSNDTTTDTVL